MHLQKDTEDSGVGELGFAERSWRYAMVVDDGVIEKIFAKDRAVAGDPFALSDAVTMLSCLSEAAAKRASA